MAGHGSADPRRCVAAGRSSARVGPPSPTRRPRGRRVSPRTRSSELADGLAAWASTDPGSWRPSMPTIVRSRPEPETSSRFPVSGRHSGSSKRRSGRWRSNPGSPSRWAGSTSMPISGCSTARADRSPRCSPREPMRAARMTAGTWAGSSWASCRVAPRGTIGSGSGRELAVDAHGLTEVEAGRRRPHATTGSRRSPWLPPPGRRGRRSSAAGRPRWRPPGSRPGPRSRRKYGACSSQVVFASVNRPSR